jgi:hypothetical protein
MTSQDPSKAFIEMAERLIEEEVEPDELQPCPICGGRLHIRFEIYGEKLGIQMWCEDCKTTMALDYSNVMPRWI